MSRTAFVVLGLLVVAVSVRSAPVPDDAFLFRGKSIKEWVKSLSDRDPATRAAGAATLAVIGPEARSAVPALRTLLKDKDPMVRYSAIRALGEIGPAANGTAEGLLEALASEDRDTRSEAVHAVRPWGKAGIPLFRKALEDRDHKVRALAASMLASVRPRPTKEAITALAHLLADEDREVRRDAALALGKAGPTAADAIPALRKATKDRDEEVCIQAAEALVHAGETQEAVAALAAMISGQESSVDRWKAAQVLGSLGPKAKDALPVLEAALKSDDGNLRVTAASALFKIDGRADAAIPILVAEMESPTEMFDDVAASLALAGVGTKAVPPLAKLLKSKENLVRQLAAHALGLVGPDASPALPALTGALKDKSPDVRQAAIGALVLIGPNGQALTALVGALGDEELTVRKDAAFALFSLGHETRKAVPVFEELLKNNGDNDLNEDHLNRVQAARALWKATGRTDVAVRILANELESEHTTKEASASILAEMRIEARAAKPALIAALKHESDSVRRSALLALAAVGGPPKEMLSAAVVALEEDECQQRVAGALVLASMGQQARSAVPILLGRLRDKEPIVRRAAAFALGRIAPGSSPKVTPLKEDDPIAEGEPLCDWFKRLRTSKESRYPWWFQTCDDVILQAVGPEPFILKGLTDCLVDPDLKVRDWALRTLCRFGPPARDAVPLLLPLLKHKHLGIRHAAAAALRTIDREAAARAGVR